MPKAFVPGPQDRVNPTANTDFPVNRASEILARYRVARVDASEIQPSPENDAIYGKINRENDPALPALIASFRRLGLEEPLIWTRDKFFLSAHRRYFACKSIGSRLSSILAEEGAR